MCREVNWTTPCLKKWQRRREIPWTAAQRGVTSNNPLVMLNTNLFLTAALLNHMHQQIPSPQNTTLSTWLLPSKKKTCSFHSTKCPSPRQPNAFLSLSAAEAIDVLPCPSIRKEGISTRNLRWRHTGSRGSLGLEDQGAEAGETEWGRNFPGRTVGLLGFFPPKRGNTAAMLWGQQTI